MRDQSHLLTNNLVQLLVLVVGIRWEVHGNMRGLSKLTCTLLFKWRKKLQSTVIGIVASKRSPPMSVVRDLIDLQNSCT